MNKRSDSPAPRTFRLSEEGRKILEAAAAHYNATEGPTTQTQVMERALRLLKRQLKLTIT